MKKFWCRVFLLFICSVTGSVFAGLENLPDEMLCEVAKLLSTRDVLNLVKSSSHFSEKSELLCKYSLRHNSFVHDSKYSSDLNFLSKKVITSWKEVALVSVVAERECSRNNWINFSFTYPEDEAGVQFPGLEVRIYPRGQHRYIGFMFKPNYASSLWLDIRSCITAFTGLQGRSVGELSDSTFFDALADNPSLRGLNLRFHNMEESFATLCRTLLPGNALSHIVSIDLASNRLSNQSLGLLSGILAANTALEYLRLSENSITDIGAGSLGAALLMNSRIKNLDLDFNYIGNAGQRLLTYAWEDYEIQERGTLSIEDNELINSLTDHFDGVDSML